MAKLLDGTRIYGNANVDSNLLVNGTTVSTSTATGTLRVAGGAGIVGAVYANNFSGISVYGGTIGNTGATFTGASLAVTGASTANSYTSIAVLAGTIGNTGATIRGNLAITNYLTGGSLNGNIYVTGNVIPTANVIYNLGNTTTWFNNIYGRSSQALYADLAENYTSDCELSPGDVVVFGGTNEITTTTVSHDDRIAGVISTNPAYLMNSKSSGYPVGLQGRLPCRVLGPVNKGQSVVSSTIAGVAQALDRTQYVPGCVIGKSLEEITTDEIRTIEVVVGRL
jgi:hypothetical protein